MRNRQLAITVLTLLAACGSANAQLRLASWNVTNYSTTIPNSRDGYFQTAIYGIAPVGTTYAGLSMNPDIFVGQEFLSQAAVNNFLNLLNTAPGSPGDWAAAPFLDGPDTDSAFFWRTSKVDYIRTVVIALGSSSTADQPRNTERYDIKPKGYDAASASIGIYSVHMKAQGGTNSSGRRLIEAQRIRDNAEGQDTNGAGTGLPAGYQFLVAGDMNAQTSSESFYVEYTGSQPVNTGRFFDPINTPGSWNNNSFYRFIHTQDPATQVDDRHDQILVGAGLVDGVGLDYIGNYPTPWNLALYADPAHSYRCWGNDGSSFDAPLQTNGNAMVGDVIATALQFTASGNGHLPVFIDLRVPAKVDSGATIDFGQVQLNATAQQSLTVLNSGNTALFGSDIQILNYSLAASSGFTAPAGPFTDAAGGATNSHVVSMDTSSVGVKSGTITITSNDPDQPTRVVTITGEVVNTPPPCPGDFNGDHSIGTADLTFLLGEFGTSVPPGTGADVSGDGFVGTADLTFLLGVFGTNCP